MVDLWVVRSKVASSFPKFRVHPFKPLASSSDDDERSEDAGDEEIDEKDEKDGFADAISKILKQDIGQNKVPVLAKRKTALMKDIDMDREDKSQQKKQKVDRKEERDKQLVVPDLMTADYERQLRKLATRGVIALFNAISKAKHDSVVPTDTKEKPAGASVKKLAMESLIK